MAVTLVSNESVIGTLTPNVYVNRITLENTGKTNLNDKNTSLISIHTAYTENLESLFDDPLNPGAGAIATADLMQKAQQEDLYTNPESVAYADSKLKVKIDMVVKEAGEGLSEFWADKSESTYVNILSAFTTDSLATKILSIGSNMLKLESTKGLSGVPYSVQTLILNGLLNDAEKQTLINLGINELAFTSTSFTFNYSADYVDNMILFLKNNTISIPKISLSEAMKNEMEGYKSTVTPYFETDADGSTIKNYKFSYEYLHDVNNPKHLSFSVMSCLDLELMEEDFGLDLDMVETPHGKLVYEQIIDNFNVNTKSFLYVNPVNNNIWAGPVHKVYADPTGGTNSLLEGAQQWRTGFAEKSDSFAVIKRSITNSKIQDFRTVERLEKLNFDLSFLETQVFNRGMSTKHITSDKMDVVKQPAYFTPLHLARDQSGNCRFMFGMDYYTLLLENTLFGKLWQPFTPFLYGDLQDNVNLIHFKVKRRRINNVPGTNPLGGFNMSKVPFKTGYLGEPHIDDEEIIETIASGKDSMSTLAATFNLKEHQIAFPETGFSNLSYGLRFFNGVDTRIRGKTDGSYQYGVELEIIDNTVNYILRQIRTLYDYYQVLCVYYEDAITPDSYDYKSNRFRKAFDIKWSQKKPGPSAAAALIQTINNFRPSQAQIATSGGSPTAMAASSALTIISDSSTGTPRGINTLRQLILNTCSKLAKMAGTSLKQFDDNPHTDDQSSSSTSKQAAYKTTTDKRRIKIEYWFPNSFDSAVPKNVGYDYLTPGSVSGGRPLTGLWTINGTQFKNRVSAETLKYFTTTNFDNDKFDMALGHFSAMSTKLTSGDTPDFTGYTFFSPSIINLGPLSPTDIPKALLGGPRGPASFATSILFAGTLRGPTVEPAVAAAVLNMKKSSWSVLGGGISLHDKKVFSYIASKIMNYNLSGRLPQASTVTDQNEETMQVFSKADSRIKFNLNEILSHKNCTTVLRENAIQVDAGGAIIIPTGEYFPADSGMNSVDSSESNFTPADKELNPLEIGFAATAENHLFLALAYYLSGDCMTELGGGEGIPEKDFNIDFFQTIDRPDTVISFLKAQFPSYNIGGEGPINDILKHLPNAIKSLLLFDKGNNRYNWSEKANLTSNANFKGAFYLNYKNIKKVEYLGGFENNNEGAVLLNAPIWKPLNKDIFDQNVDKNLFCRLATYKNAAFGVQMPNCLKLPVFNEYFILKPAAGVIIPTVPILPVFQGIPPMPTLDGGTGDISDYMSTGVGIPYTNPPSSGGGPLGDLTTDAPSGVKWGR